MGTGTVGYRNRSEQKEACCGTPLIFFSNPFAAAGPVTHGACPHGLCGHRCCAVLSRQLLRQILLRR